MPEKNGGSERDVSGKRDSFAIESRIADGLRVEPST
jgi:hypothetical protein